MLESAVPYPIPFQTGQTKDITRECSQGHPDSQDPGLSTPGAAATLLCLLHMVIVRRELAAHPSGPPVATSPTLTSSFLVLKAGPSANSFRKPSRLLFSFLSPQTGGHSWLQHCDLFVVYLLPSPAGFLSDICAKPVFLKLPGYTSQQRCLLKA